jgi:hypothetical protein
LALFTCSGIPTKKNDENESNAYSLVISLILNNCS